MDPIGSELINAIPDSIEAERDRLPGGSRYEPLVLFTLANELEPAPEMPPIISNGVELYPLPPPWTYAPPMRLAGRKIDTHQVLATVNEWLPHIRKNAEAYNEALGVNDVPTAVRIAQQGVNDSAMIWSTTNALAMSVEAGNVYRALELSAETKEAYEAIGRLRA